MSRTLDSKIKHCSVVGGEGAVGKMFVGFLRAAGVEVCVIDLVASGSTNGATSAQLLGDITNPSKEIEEVLSVTDCVLLAVPEAVTLAAIEVVSSMVSGRVMIAHTCSVQGPVKAKLEELEPPLESVGFNPMFGPSLPPHGRPVAAVVVRDGPLVRHLVAIVEGAGVRVVRLSAVEHDRICGVSQSATHAAIISFGLSLLDSGVSIEDLARLAPPPCVTMLSLLARVATGAPEVYWDVQTGNPNGAPSRLRIVDALRQLSQTVDIGNFREFERDLNDVAVYLGAGLEYFASIGQRLLSELPIFDEEGFGAR